jgi:hypothetical protein
VTLICSLLVLAVAQDAHHGHHHEDEQEPERPVALSLPLQRDGSGTSWLPDSSPMYMLHGQLSGWALMLHGSIAFGYDDQLGDRGSHRFLSTNWLMGMASHELLSGQLSLKAMLSLEGATAAGPGQIPLLLQTGETYGGAPLHDKQHPHDLFMEVAARWRVPLGQSLGLELYAAPAGEPALGPPAFMHRASALVDPLPPIGHHWQDSTHISFGVLTAGVFTRVAKLEASLFNGREPDENRWNFDLGPLDSFSARLSVNPTATTALQVSYGHLVSPEAIAPDENIDRVTASAQWTAPVFAQGALAMTALWGANIEHREIANSALLEATLDSGGANVPYARLEWVQKTGADLVIVDRPDDLFNVFQASLGYVYRLPALGPVVPGLGARVDLGLVPASIESLYGTRWPVGFFVYLLLQPPRMQH